MKKILFYTMLFAVTAVSAAASNNPDPDKTVNDIIANIEKSVISADFSLTVNTAGNEYSVTGTFVLKNEKFKIETLETKIWFDGKTQWTYSPQINEVSITEPDKTELQSVNPLLLIKNINRSCTKKLGNSQSPKNHTIILTPKTSGAEFEKIELAIDKTSGNPAQIILYGKDKSITDFKMTNCKHEKNIADSNFIFNKNNYKGIFINDLR